MPRLILFLVSGMLLLSAEANATVWKFQTSKDDFSGTSYSYVISSITKPNKPLEFPYKDLTAYLVIYCSVPKDLYMTFSSSPNLIGAHKTDRDYSLYSTDVRLDGQIIRSSFIHENNERKRIKFYDGATTFVGHKDVAIQIKHYVGTTHYVFDMSNVPKCK
jgi:hypothetical protein